MENLLLEIIFKQANYISRLENALDTITSEISSTRDMLDAIDATLEQLDLKKPYRS